MVKIKYSVTSVTIQCFYATCAKDYYDFLSEIINFHRHTYAAHLF